MAVVVMVEVVMVADTVVVAVPMLAPLVPLRKDHVKPSARMFLTVVAKELQIR